MNIKYIASEALDSLASNMRKALLAALGLLVGVTAVVCVIAAGQGLKTIIMKEMGSYGRPTSLSISANWRYLWETNYVDSPETITDEDIEDIKNLTGLVRGVSPLSEFQFQAGYGNKSNVTRLVCVSSDYFPMEKLQLERGRMFNAEDDVQKRRAAILGANLTDKLFGKPGSHDYEDPLGKRITIGSFGEVEVIGILKKEETSLFSGFSNYDNTNNGTLFVPYSTATRFGGQNRAWNILAEAESEETIDRAEKAILAVFARNHGYWGEGVNKFRVESGKSAIEEVSLMTGLVTTFIAVVAGLSLIVAGIGVMNVMLISVKERTREIGTRKALGARGSWIGQQFLLESLAVCLSGGLGGVVLAYIIAQIVSRVSQWPALVPPGALPLSLLLSVLVSLAFGFLPARRASKLDPCEALRYE
ncbi:MAG TPA: ABC transporter permease [Treponemataceae bacterium]|nr:ABC transporter permease [Treponemataceae bacterium]